MSRSAKTSSFRIPFAAVLLLAALLLAPAAGAKKSKKPTDPNDLFNPLLGVEYSHWLVGPIVEMATAKEVEEFLLLAGDEAAASFVQEFWSRRNEGAGFFKKTQQQIFAARVEEADKRFTEGAYPGSRSDRGTIYVLYGEPEEETYESATELGRGAREVWKYGKNAEPGLDGKKPKKEYRFVRDGDRTVLLRGFERPLTPAEKQKRARGRYNG